MDPKAPRYLLFPHTSLSTPGYRHAAILLPDLYLLQAVREPPIPEWGRDHFHAWPAITQPQALDRIKACLEGYREFARVHGEGLIEASLSHESIVREACEARYNIQEEVRSKGKETGDPKEIRLITAATFIEMALDLDERERELETGYAELQNLEGEFREILGINGAEELDEALETINLPFTKNRANISFMLPRRMDCWLQLFSAHPVDGFPVFVATSRETIEEILDPLLMELDREGKPLDLLESDLGSIPRLDNLTPGKFLSLLAEVQESKILRSYLQAMEKISSAPDNDNIVEIQGHAKALQESIREFFRKESQPVPGDVVLSLTCIRGLAPGEFWRRLNNNAWEVWGEERALQGTPTIFLCMQ